MEDLTEDERRDIIEDDLRAEADALDDDTFAGSDGLCSTSSQRLFKNLAVAAEESLDSSTFKSYKQYVSHRSRSLVFCLSILVALHRIWSKITDYCVRKGFIPTKDFFDSGPIPVAAPDYFALYIAHESESLCWLHVKPWIY